MPTWPGPRTPGTKKDEIPGLEPVGRGWGRPRGTARRCRAGAESQLNDRCLTDPFLTCVPDQPPSGQERIVWQKPMVVVRPNAVAGGVIVDVRRAPTCSASH